MCSKSVTGYLCSLHTQSGAPVPEWLERTLVVREISGSISGWRGNKNLCGRRGSSDYISFCRSVKKTAVSYS